MAKDTKPAQPQGGGQVIQLVSQCPVEGCGKKVTRSEFCADHFVWFKEGLITRDGEKPKDFDKKYQMFLQKSKKAA